jgi:hypothetical protein
MNFMTYRYVRSLGDELTEGYVPSTYVELVDGPGASNKYNRRADGVASPMRYPPVDAESEIEGDFNNTQEN